MVAEIIQDHFVGVAITLFLILFILTNNNFEKRINRLFLMAACCVLILIVTEIWEAQLALRETYTPLRIFLSAIGYTLRTVVPYLLILLMKRFSGVKLIWLSVPLVYNALVSFSALFCDISFGYTQSNVFVRGPLGYTPFAVAVFYGAILLAVTMSGCRNGGMREAMIVSAIVLLGLVATVLESVFHIRFIQVPGMAASITFYYLFLHSNQNNRDPLTGALTRRRFYLDAQRYATSLSAVISLDLNNLKTLNDEGGHVEGDKALVSVADIISRYTGSKASLYRIGGDEFMILCFRMGEADVLSTIRKIQADLDKTPYRCAIGYAPYSFAVTFDHVCHIADSRMYENKREMKGQALRVQGIAVEMPSGS